MGIPVGGNYPKMVTGTLGGRTVPLVYPAGNAKQFQLVILQDNAAEQAYAASQIGVVPVNAISSGPSNSWENRHGK